VEIKEQYQVKISNRFAALENLDDDNDDDDDVDINRVWGKYMSEYKSFGHREPSSL
jgi:hypothetical protein